MFDLLQRYTNFFLKEEFVPFPYYVIETWDEFVGILNGHFCHEKYESMPIIPIQKGVNMFFFQVLIPGGHLLLKMSSSPWDS